MKFAMIGERSKVGQSILTYLKQNPSNWEYVDISDSPDYLFLATSSEDSKIYFEKYKNDFKIVDFSNAFKEKALNKLEDFSYGFSPFFDKTKKHIAFTGCSSLASMTALYPVKDFIVQNFIFIDVKFSKSALQRKSELHKKLEESSFELAHPFIHYHEKEINLALGLDVKMIHSVINAKEGLFLNVFLNLHTYIDLVKFYQGYYAKEKDVIILSNQDITPDISKIIGTNKIILQVHQDRLRVGVSVMTDNLINGKVFKLLS